MAPRRADPFLLLALASGAALVASARFEPSTPVRALVGLVGGVWATGYALVALAYPRSARPLVGLERHALAMGLGLLLVPVLALVTSATLGFGPLRLAVATLAATALLAAGAALRGHTGSPEAPTRAGEPSRRAAALAVGLVLVAGGGVAAHALATVQPEPPSLAMTHAGGPLPLTLRVGDEVRVQITASAGAQAASGALLVRMGERVAHDEQVSLAPGETLLVEALVPTERAGKVDVVASWAGREVHATFHVEGKR